MHAIIVMIASINNNLDEKLCYNKMLNNVQTRKPSLFYVHNEKA